MVDAEKLRKAKEEYRRDVQEGFDLFWELTRSMGRKRAGIAYTQGINAQIGVEQKPDRREKFWRGL